MLIIAQNVSKKIRKKNILSDVNLKLESGNVYGFIGENGSGKTMLFRALAGLMDISDGQILIDDKELGKDIKTVPNLGIIIENAGLYPELSGFDNLKLLAKINNRITDDDIRNAIERVGLEPKDRRPFRKYSLGMKQRIVFAQAIMEKPEILILDEPTNALDAAGVELIRNIITEEKKRGALVLIASHNREDIDFLADEIYCVNAGKIGRLEV